MSLDLWLSKSLPTNVLKDVYCRGMRRLAELGWRGEERVTTTKHGFRMHVNRLDAIKWYIHYFGEFEPQITNAWKNLIPAGGTVIDIGGNIGYHALLAATCVGPSGKVVTFEPCSKVFSDLVANIKLNGADQVTAVKEAVSDQPGEVLIRYAGENEQGSSSIIRGGGEGEAVKAISFDQISRFANFEDIDLIKIDVEGAEHLVIAGMTSSIHKLKRSCTIFIEIGPEHSVADILSPFMSAGFHAVQIENEYRTSFYRNRRRSVDIRPLQQGGKLCDVVLSRDPTSFSKMCGTPPLH